MVRLDDVELGVKDVVVHGQRVCETACNLVDELS